MDPTQLLDLDAETAGRKLAALAVLSSRLSKQADLASSAASIRDAVLTGLKSGDPRYLAGAGAVGLGGASLANEALKPKEKRRFSNVLPAAGLGAVMGAAAPTAIAGLSTVANGSDPSKFKPPNQVERVMSRVMSFLTGKALTAPAEVGAKAVETLGTPATALGSDIPQGVADTMRGFKYTTTGGLATGAIRATAPAREMFRGYDALRAKQTPTSGTVLPGVGDNTLRHSMEHIRNATNVNPLTNPGGWLGGHVDQQLAAGQGLPKSTPALGAPTPNWKDRWQTFRGNSSQQLLGGSRAPQHANTLRAAGRSPTRGWMSMIPTGLGLAADAYQQFVAPSQ